MITYIDPETRYSDATIHNGIIYLGGQVPEDAEADAAAQTRSASAQMDALLVCLNSDKAHIPETSAGYDTMNRVRDAWITSCCGQAAFADPRWKVEIGLTFTVKA